MTVIASPRPAECSVDELLAHYDAFLIDAYGVLVTTSGPLAGAAAFLERLDREGKPWLIVTNDATRSIQTTAARYQQFGLPVTTDRVLTSGSLLTGYFAREGLVGARCVVLGTDESRAYVREAGGIVVAPDDRTASVFVSCGVSNEGGVPYVDALNRTISTLLYRLESGLPATFVLPNPDVVYPTDPGNFALTAGGIAATLQAVIDLRNPGGRHRFAPLGKPHAPMFDAAFARLPAVDRRRIVMVGDQLGTDVLGAATAGIDSVLVETGVARRSDLVGASAQPTWLLRDLEP
jgi:glycerol 3-phosphatase-2